jgi:hypothetical protein
MILRRVIQHVRKQEWTAIAIDFVIVVFGVFMGIQVANWNQAQNDIALGTAYLKRIQLDMDADIATYQDRLAFWQQVIDYGTKALAYAEGKADDKTDVGASEWELILAYFQASQLAEFYSTMATYNELTNAGDLRLLGNVAIRNEVTKYYTYSNNYILSERPQYREQVRGLIPITIQTYIWASCYATKNSSEQSLIDCPPPPNLTDSSAVLHNLTSNQTLVVNLRYWISTQIITKKIGIDRMNEAENLKGFIAAELDAAK